MAEISLAPSGSADRHGIPRADAEHAIRHHDFWIREFDDPRAPGLARPDLFIGRDASGKVQLGVMANWLVGGDLEVFHVMPCETRFESW